ncbi:MAG: tyrosine recombinase XerC [Burkholderiales bacterium]|nr:tyrosine recombinase XerC [Burkholderiales bacterium]
MSDGPASDPRGAPLAAYLRNLSDERRLSAHTVSAYARDITTLLALVPDVPLERIGAHAVRRAIARLHAQGRSGRSLARTLSAWRGFFGWLARHQALAANPCAGVRAPRSPRALPKALSPDAAARLLDPAAEAVLEVRDKAIFELAYSSGLRLAELVGLDVDDARAILRSGEVIVTGKGRKTRAVPVGRHARAALGRWLAARGPVARSDEQALFVSARGRRIAPRSVQLRLKRWALRAGLDGGVHPHVLRHSFASHVLQSAGDLRAVQEMLGHASISTTQVYTKLDFQHLARVYDQTHPRARKRRG